jgi:hypothetical protein
MIRKQLDLTPAVARAFVEDKRDEIAVGQHRWL